MKRVLIVLGVAIAVCASLPAFAETGKAFFSVQEDGMGQPHKLDANVGECVVYISEEKEVMLITPKGMKQCWLPKGQGVVVDRMGVARWVREHGNMILEHDGEEWRPKGAKECATPEGIIAPCTPDTSDAKPFLPKATPKPFAFATPKPTPKAGEKKTIVPKKKEPSKANPTPAPTPVEVTKVAEAENAQEDDEQLQPVARQFPVRRDLARREAYVAEPRPQYLPVVQTNDQKVYVNQAVVQEKKKDRTALMAGGVILGLGAIAAAFVYANDQGHHSGYTSPTGPPPEPPN